MGSAQKVREPDREGTTPVAGYTREDLPRSLQNFKVPPAQFFGESAFFLRGIGCRAAAFLKSKWFVGFPGGRRLRAALRRASSLPPKTEEYTDAEHRPECTC